MKDTKDFLKKLEKVKDILQESLLVTLDIKSLYTNIPNYEDIKAVKESYKKIQRKNSIYKSSAFHPSEVDKMSTRNLVVKSKLPLQSGSSLEAVEPLP